MPRFNPDDTKAVQAVKDKIQAKQQQLDDLQAQLTETQQEIAAFKEQHRTARVALELDNGTQKEVTRARTQLEEINQKTTQLQTDIEVKQEAINHLQNQYEDARAKVVRDFEQDAAPQHEQLVKEAVQAFLAFAEKAETLKEFENTMPPEISIGNMGLTRGELYRRQAPKLPQWMEKARNKGFNVFDN